MQIHWTEVAAAERRTAVQQALADGATFRMCFGDRHDRGVEIIHLFSAPQGGLSGLRTRLEGETAVDSLVDVLPSAHWDEREVQDMFGVRFRGHPDPRPLLLPDSYLGPPPQRPAADVLPREAWQPRGLAVQGGVEVPVGPVHAGIIESGHFRFSTIGETVLQLDARLFWNHRGVEPNLEGRTIAEAVRIVERTCGSCSAAHQEAFAQAVEAIAGLEVPDGTQQWRLAVLEMERIYNHLNDLAQLATGVALGPLAQQGMRLKERALRLQGGAFGHRYLFGVIRPGTVRPPEDLPALVSGLQRLAGDSDEWAGRLFSNVAFRDRLQGIGTVPGDVARALGAVGPAARASGIAADVRSDCPYGAYRQHPVAPVVQIEGDAMARAQVRRGELTRSFDLAVALLAAGGRAQYGPAEVANVSGNAAAIVESPRGADAQYLRLEGGRVRRLHLRSASFANWPLIMVAAVDNPIGDFPLINKSFELCYACCDR